MNEWFGPALRLALACCWPLLCAWPVLAQVASAPAGPRIEIPVLVQTCPPVLEGEAASARFVLRNTGQAVLRLQEIRTGCACVEADGPGALEPGAEAELRLRVDTTGLPGPRTFRAVIHSNDPARPALAVALKTEVRPLVSLRPDRFFLRGLVGQALVGEIEIVNQGAVPLELSLESGPAHPDLSANLVRIVPGKHYRLVLRCAGESAATIRDRLILRGSIPGREKIAAPVLVDVQPPVELLPAHLVLRQDRPARADGPWTGRFMVRALDGQALGPPRVRPGPAGLACAVEALADGRYWVTVAWRPPAKEGLPEALEIEISHGGQERLLSLPLRLETAGWR